MILSQGRLPSEKCPQRATSTSLSIVFRKVESMVRPLGAALRYSSGGNGLIGLADSWPNVGSDTRSVNAYDHYWQSFNPALKWTIPVLQNRAGLKIHDNELMDIF